MAALATPRSSPASLGPQRGDERAAKVTEVGYDYNAILNAIKTRLDRGQYECSNLYSDAKAGLRISNLLCTIELTIDKRLPY